MSPERPFPKEPLRVVMVTTLYPRNESDHHGRFLAEEVEHLRTRGIGVEVVAPGVFRDFGLAYGAGVPHNVRRRPWAAPLMVGSMTNAVRRAAARADLVHAHWLPAALPAALSGRPFVVTLHGTDVELALRVPLLARPLLRAAKGVICVSNALAAQARRLGARNPCVIPHGIDLPALTEDETTPLEVLFVGRLARDKGIEELIAATQGLNLVVVGDGPLRGLVPKALGFVPREQLSSFYRRAAVVVCPSRREGFGLVCAEAMAHGRPVIASAVGGLLDMVVDGATGLLVPPGDPRALRAALDRILADRELRRRLGTAGRARIAAISGWERVIDETLTVYGAALAS